MPWQAIFPITGVSRCSSRHRFIAICCGRGERERVPKSRQMPVQTCWPRAGRRRPKALMAAPLTALPRSRALSMEREHDCRLLDAASRRADSRKAGLVMRPISRVIPLIIAGIVGIGAVGIGSWPPLTAEWAHRVVPSPPASPRLLSGRRARLSSYAKRTATGHMSRYRSTSGRNGTYFFDFGPVPASFDHVFWMFQQKWRRSGKDPRHSLLH